MRTPTLFLLLLLLAAGSGQAQRSLTNAGLEIIDGTNAPPNWLLTRSNCTVSIDSITAFEGARAAGLDCTGLPSPANFGSMLQAIDPAPYRGKRVVLRAAVRADRFQADGGAGLWLRVDKPAGEMGFFDNMTNRRITADEWSFYEIVGDVAEDATGLSLGLLVVGSGRAWIDAVSISVAGDAPRPIVEAARVLDGRGLENLVAFTRLLGYVRYFHPSDQAAATDWEEFAIESVRAVEAASDANQLALTLRELFLPIAPTVVIRAGSAADASEAWDDTALPDGNEVLSGGTSVSAPQIHSRSTAVTACVPPRLTERLSTTSPIPTARFWPRSEVG